MDSAAANPDFNLAGMSPNIDWCAPTSPPIPADIKAIPGVHNPDGGAYEAEDTDGDGIVDIMEGKSVDTDGDGERRWKFGQSHMGQQIIK